ncbi:hypothetical protein [Proteus phage PM 116]|uniref:Uncharacterized protein n=1 Tax=Proteus phage PM 116 TaxID=1837877 RepID=A0A2D0VJZ6_9CAUD|nr:hypothetical protein HOS11_gp22 [Proteus phage PM 116]ANU80104.1 hypothetical protein [Proteus phage PM 116]
MSTEIFNIAYSISLYVVRRICKVVSAEAPVAEEAPEEATAPVMTSEEEEF